MAPTPTWLNLNQQPPELTPANLPTSPPRASSQTKSWPTIPTSYLKSLAPKHHSAAPLHPRPPFATPTSAPHQTPKPNPRRYHCVLIRDDKHHSTCKTLHKPKPSITDPFTRSSESNHGLLFRLKQRRFISLLKKCSERLAIAPDENRKRKTDPELESEKRPKMQITCGLAALENDLLDIFVCHVRRHLDQRERMREDV